MRFSPSARACRLTFLPMLRIMKAPKGVFFMRHASDPTCGRNEVRIAYVLCQQDLQRAIRVLGEALKRYRREVMGEE